MTDEELKNLVASIAISQKKTDEQIKQLKISQAQTDEQIKKTDEQIKKTDELARGTHREVEEMSRTLKNLGLNIDGINKSIGLEAEEFFYTSLNKNKILNDIKFDSISSNLRVQKDGKEHEIDIFLENGNSVGIIEVKNRVSEKHIKQLQNIVDGFYFFHPAFKNYKIIPALAGKIFPKHLQKKALKNNFTVITQVGNHIEEKNPN